jgi:hypothetical protein
MIALVNCRLPGSRQPGYGKHVRGDCERGDCCGRCLQRAPWSVRRGLPASSSGRGGGCRRAIPLWVVADGWFRRAVGGGPLFVGSTSRVSTWRLPCDCRRAEPGEQAPGEPYHAARREPMPRRISREDAAGPAGERTVRSRTGCAAVQGDGRTGACREDAARRDAAVWGGVCLVGEMLRATPGWGWPLTV